MQKHPQIQKLTIKNKSNNKIIKIKHKRKANIKNKIVGIIVHKI